MSNPYYTHGSFPSTGAAATSASMRAELDLISAAFDKLPTLTSNANKFVVVNSTATGLTTTSTLPIASVNDSEFTFQDTADNTRKFQFAADAITPGATRLFTMPDADTTLVGTGTTQTLTNKTLTAPVIATIVNTGTLTLPTSTDTLVGRATTDTLTNKTLTNPTIGTILNTGTLTLPTSTDTLVGRATTDTLTNKTISGANNSLTNIGNSSLTNSAVTIGSSSLSLGGTLTTLAGVTISGASNTLSNIANASLTNSGVTFNGVTVALGASGTLTASTTNALTIGTGLQLDTGTTFNGGAARTLSIDSTVATLSGSQTLSNKTISGSSNTLSNIANASLTNSSITIGSSSISLGSTASTISGLTSLSATGLIMTANAASSTAISAIAQSAGTVTVTAAGHGLTSGDLVSIDGVADYSYTGLVTVNVTNANVFTYSRVTTNASSSGGYVTKLQGTWASYSGGTGPAYRNGPSVYEANSQMPALRVTQTGNGYAFIVEDATNPDTSAFIISNAGDLAINTNKFTVAAATGNTVIGGTTSLAGNVTFATDATYDIGASGANRPRDLFLSRNLTVGGTLTLAGGVNLNGNVTIGDAAADTLTVNSTITSNLIFTDNTYDIGASGATRPRNLYLANSAVVGGSITTPTITVNLPTATDAAAIRGSASGSASLVMQSSAGTGVAYWLSAKTGGTLAIGGNGASEPSLGAINIGSTGLVGIGSTSNYPLGIQKNGVQVGATNAYIIASVRDGVPNKGISLGYDSTNQIGIVLGDSNSAASAIAFWTYNTDGTGWAETARFDAGRNLLVGTTVDYGVGASKYVFSKNGYVIAADNTSSASNMNWAITPNGSTAGALDFINSPNNTAWPNNAYVFSLTQDTALFRYSDVVISNINGTTKFFRAYEVGVAGNNAGFSMGQGGVKGSIYGASGLGGIRIVGGSGQIFFGGYTGDTSVYANYNSYGIWNSNGLGIGNTNPGAKLHTTSSGLGDGGGIRIENTGAGGSYFSIWPTATINGEAANKLVFTGTIGNIFALEGATGNIVLGAPSSAGASQRATFNNATGGIGLGWGDVNGNYINIFGAYSSGALVLAAGLQGNQSSDAYTSSYGGGSIYRNAIRLDTFNGTGIQFFTNNSSTVARGTAVSLTEAGRFSSGGYFGLGVTNPQQKLDLAGVMRFTANTADLNYWAQIYANYNSSHPFQIDVKNNGTTFEMWGMYANSGGGNERISSPSLDVVVGVTDRTGSISNDVSVISGRFRTMNGSLTQTGGGAWYDAFTLVNPGLYILHAYIGGYNAGPSDWSNAWFITYTGGNNAYVGASVFGATGNIQCQRKTGTAATIQLYLGGGAGIGYAWIVQRIG